MWNLQMEEITERHDPDGWRLQHPSTPHPEETPMQTRVTWKDGMAFSADLDGFTLSLDADPAFGGQNRGPRPKGLTLVSLGGCTAMDVIAMLTKMRQQVTGLSVVVDGKIADDHPKRIESITVCYEVTGVDLDPARVRRAVELSESTYCGVSATLRPGVQIRSEIWINGARIE
jgi:putative redox protein